MHSAVLCFLFQGVYGYVSEIELRILTSGAWGVEEFDDAAITEYGCKLAM